MNAGAISEQQSEALLRILRKLAEDCEARSVAVCDATANILAQETRSGEKSIDTVSALAVGAFAATRELAYDIGESGFKSISYRGDNSGILIRSLGGDYLLIVVLSERSTEGLVRLYLRKVTPQIQMILSETSGQSAEDAGAAGSFEVQESPESTL